MANKNPSLYLEDSMDSFQRLVKNYINAKNKNDSAGALEAYNLYYEALKEIENSSVLQLKDVTTLVNFLGPFLDDDKAGADIKIVFNACVDLKESCTDFVSDSAKIIG